MLDLPKRIGPLTLMRHMASQGLNNEYMAILDEPAGKRVLVRRVDLQGTESEETLQALHALQIRVRHLQEIDNPSLVSIACAHIEDGAYYIGEDRSDHLSLREIIRWFTKRHGRLPHAVFLHIAMQACNALDALHRFKPTGIDKCLLHEALCPDALFLDREGTCRLGNYSLSAVGMSWTTSSVSVDAAQLAYLSPEQTSSRDLQRSSDIFSLGVTLYELWALRHMFLADTTLQTLQRIRTGQVTANLTDVRDTFSGLDRALYRALSLNPRHRYQQVLVLKEDLRALMAGFSFVNIDSETKAALAPIFDAREFSVTPDQPPRKELSTGSLLTRLVVEARAETLGAPEGPPPKAPEPALASESKPLSPDLSSYSDDEVALISLPPATMESFLADPNESDTPSEPDSDDTLALIRDLSRRRDGEVDYSPAHQLEPLYDADEDSTSVISIPPLPLRARQPDETVPMVFGKIDTSTDMLSMPTRPMELDDEDTETTAAGPKGDTIPIPRPLSPPPEKLLSSGSAEQKTDDIVLVAHQIELDDSFSINEPRSKVLQIVLLVFIAILVLCTGTIGTAIWLFARTQ